MNFIKGTIVACVLALGLPVLAGCADDGSLKPDARAQLEEASRWGHRISMGAHGAIVAVTVACQDNASEFCAKAMPIVGKVEGAVGLFDGALVIADKALATTGTPEEQLVAALGDLIKFERDVEEYLKQIGSQTAGIPPLIGGGDNGFVIGGQGDV